MGRNVLLVGVLLAFCSILGMVVMPLLAFFVGLLLGIVLLVAGVVLALIEDREAENAAWRQFSQANGFELQPSLPTDSFPRSISLFEHAKTGSCSNVIPLRVNGFPGHLFRYSYDDGGDSLEGPFAVLLLSGVVPGLPDFSVGPKDVFGILGFTTGKHAGFADTETGRRFGEHYQLRTSDTHSVLRFFDERMFAYFADKPRLFMECRKGQVAVWFKGGGGRSVAQKLLRLSGAACCLLPARPEEGGAGEG